MNHAVSSSPISRQARLLLQAWQRGDGRLLRSALEETLARQTGPAAPEIEAERHDLLCGIALRMRSCLTDGHELATSSDMEVPLRLLRHLTSDSVH